MIAELRRRIRRAWLELALLLGATAAALEAPRLPYRPFWLAGVPVAGLLIDGIIVRIQGDCGAIRRLRRPYRLFIDGEDL